MSTRWGLYIVYSVYIIFILYKQINSKWSWKFKFHTVLNFWQFSYFPGSLHAPPVVADESKAGHCFHHCFFSSFFLHLLLFTRLGQQVRTSQYSVNTMHCYRARWFALYIARVTHTGRCIWFFLLSDNV